MESRSQLVPAISVILHEGRMVLPEWHEPGKELTNGTESLTCQLWPSLSLNHMANLKLWFCLKDI